MNLNTICLRIFYVLCGGLFLVMTIAGYGKSFLTPLAIAFLETDSAIAVVPDPTSLIVNATSSQQTLRTTVNYAGRTETLYTVLPIYPGSSRDIPGYHHSIFLIPEAETNATIPVKYVKAFPPLVQREIPNSSIWTHYSDTWRLKDMFIFLVLGFITLLLAYLFYRSVKRSRAWGWR